MGMFDTVRSSYDLGPGYHKDLQTKDLECLMMEYWIDPNGNLFEIDYSHTQDFTDDFTHYTANGNHGKVRPWRITKYIRVYPERWDGDWKDWPECRIHFKDGKLQDYEHSSKGEWK